MWRIMKMKMICTLERNVELQLKLDLDLSCVIVIVIVRLNAKPKPKPKRIVGRLRECVCERERVSERACGI